MPVQEWKLDGVLDELAKIDESMKDRSFAFILGAGASFKSGIPTGKELARRWLHDLHKRECLDDAKLDDWLKSGALGIDGVCLERAAEYYSQIFERRFRGDPESGYAELEKVMEGQSPSLGYSLLAELIQHTRHKVVVTTNFDNLVADALAMHAHQSPLVVAHEALAGFVRPQLRRPLVAKIHRDLFLAPKNDPAGVDNMEHGWQQALRKLFQHYTPIVVGYGGNDGSLMGLLGSLNKGEIAGRMIWCYRDGSAPPQVVRDVLEQHDGIQVKIAGFDEFMLQLAAKLVKNFDVVEVAERTERLGRERAERYREQAKDLGQSSAKGSSAQQQAGELLSKSLRDTKNTSWWAWQMRADNEPDLQKRDAIYLEGLRHFPKSGELHGNYANFLVDKLGADDAAEEMYKKAIELDPSNALPIGNYAIFLANNRKNHEAAESHYKHAIELDSSARHFGNYALFLAKRPDRSSDAQAMYKRALELNSSDPVLTCNYAIFLANRRIDLDMAEFLYKRTLKLDPASADAANCYANFLADCRHDLDGAETMYKLALDLGPSDAVTIGNYANFLADQRQDHVAAERYYKDSLALDPSSAATKSNYAAFLCGPGKDLELAERHFLDAIELDPDNPDVGANYCALLLSRGNAKDAGKVRELSERAISNCQDQAVQVNAEALFYLCLHHELTNGNASAHMARLKALLFRGYWRESWDFNWLLDAVLPRIAPDRTALYRALADAILDDKQVARLDEFDTWRALPAAEPQPQGNA